METEMKKLIAIALLLASCASASYPVTGSAKKAQKKQQDTLQSQFRTR